MPIVTDTNLDAVSDPPKTALYATGTDILINEDSEENIPNSTYTKIKQITITKIVPANSTLNIYFELRGQLAGASIGYARIYRNGVAVGAERVVDGGVYGDAYLPFESNITVQNGDTIELWGKWAVSSGARVKNFRIRGNPIRDCFRAHVDVV